MKDYLGITPKDDVEGALQDVHWSAGLFGYFPTYNLGAIYATQIFQVAKKEISGLEEQMAQGNFGELRTWLKNKVHQVGSLLETDELIKNITGETINSQHHIDRLKQKYTEIYRL